MKRHQVIACFISFLASATFIFGQAPEKIHIESIRVVTLSNPQHTYSIKQPSAAESTIRIDLEHDSDRFDILVALAAKNAKVKLEQRYETSITVQDEGPHLDLVNWKHFISDWVAVPSNKTGCFRSLVISKEESGRFPDVELSSVLEEIKRQDPKWLNVVKNAKSIAEYPFAVGVSVVSFRISAWMDGKWVPIHIIHCKRPMGC